MRGGCYNEVVVGSGGGNDAEAGLCVDVQGAGGVTGVDLIDVVIEIALEKGGVANAAEVGGEHTQVATLRGFDDEAVPRFVVARALGLQRRSDKIEAVGFEAGHGEVLVGEGAEIEGKGYGGDEVDIRDVGVELSGVEGKFAECPVDVDVGVGGVGYGGFDKGRTGV